VLNLLQGWNASLTGGFPPLFNPTGQLGNPFQGFTVPPPGTALTVPPPAAAGIMSGLPAASIAAAIAAGASPLAALLGNKPSPAKGLNALLGRCNGHLIKRRPTFRPPRI